MKTRFSPRALLILSLRVYRMMGTCGGTSSSLCRPACVSWCVEAPTPVTTATEESSLTNHQSAGSGSIPLLLLSPPETSSSASRNTDRAANSQSDEGGGDGNDPPEAENRSKEDASRLHPEAGRFLLPRSSAVISRRHRPVSWHGGETDTSDPPSSDSPSPPPGSLSLDQCGRLTVASMEDLGSKPKTKKKQSCVSVSSNRNPFISLFHLHFSGQQGLAEEQKGRRRTSCDASPTPGVSTSTKYSKQRSCSSIPEFPAAIFKTSCELEKENAHFVVVDMVLEVLEGVKWTLSFDQWTSTMDTHRHTDHSTCAHRHTSSAEDSPARAHRQRCKANGRTTSARSSHTHTNQHTQDTEEDDTGNDEPEPQPKSFSFLSTDSGFEDCGVDTTLTPKDSLRSAEVLAQQLVLEFRRSWLPSRELRRGRQSLRSSLQELPGTGSVAVSGGSLTEEIRLRTRMRGSLSWAPPRFQIIFTVQPTLRRSEVVALQHFLCAGCGTEVEPRYMKKLRYCEYLGRYFCDCCHSGSEAVIPARVLSCWDFGRYPVSDFSKQLLDSVWHQPLFDLSCVGKTLCGRVKELDKFRELQEHLRGLVKLLKACRLSGRVMTEFEQLPAHLIFEQPHLFSMDDLLRVKKGQLVAQAKAVLQSAISHVENCELCQARGFICEFCRERDIIFPFQTDVCSRCPVCKTCFHKQCFVEKKCPKCARIQSRKKRP